MNKKWKVIFFHISSHLVVLLEEICSFVINYGWTWVSFCLNFIHPACFNISWSYKYSSFWSNIVHTKKIVLQYLQTKLYVTLSITEYTCMGNSIYRSSVSQKVNINFDFYTLSNFEIRWHPQQIAYFTAINPSTHILLRITYRQPNQIIA